MTKREVAKILAYIGAAYPRIEVPEGTLALYREHLEGERFEAIMARAREHVRTSPYYPTVAELLRNEAPQLPAYTPEPLPEPNAEWPALIRAQLSAMREHKRLPPPPGEAGFCACGGVLRDGRCFYCGRLSS